MSAGKAPTSAKVFGILNLLYAAFAVGVTTLLTVGDFIMLEGGDNPIRALFSDTPGFPTTLIVAAGVALLVNGLLAISGVGLLMGKSWGRMTALIYSILQVFLALISFALNYALAYGPVLEKLSHRGGDAPQGIVVIWVVTTGFCCSGLIYPAILGLFMFRMKLNTGDADDQSAYRNPV